MRQLRGSFDSAAIRSAKAKRCSGYRSTRKLTDGNSSTLWIVACSVNVLPRLGSSPTITRTEAPMDMNERRLPVPARIPPRPCPLLNSILRISSAALEAAPSDFELILCRHYDVICGALLKFGIESFSRVRMRELSGNHARATPVVGELDLESCIELPARIQLNTEELRFQVMSLGF